MWLPLVSVTWSKPQIWIHRSILSGCCCFFWCGLPDVVPPLVAYVLGTVGGDRAGGDALAPVPTTVAVLAEVCIFRAGSQVVAGINLPVAASRTKFALGRTILLKFRHHHAAQHNLYNLLKRYLNHIQEDIENMFFFFNSANKSMHDFGITYFYFPT